MTTSRSRNSTQEWLAFIVMIAGLALFYFWYGWRWVPGIIQDQGWFLQVSARVAQGDVLYRDVLWAYGPLPVLLMSWLMQFARNDIAYYSAMNITLAISMTGALYRLHRYIFSPRNAVITTVIAMVGLGNYLIFFRAYTPGVSFSILAAMTMLCGIAGSLTGGKRLVSTGLIAVGIAVCTLCKPEFALVTLGVGILVLITSWRVRVDLIDRTHVAIDILVGISAGLAISGAVYLALVNVAGWENVWTGVTGYEQLRLMRDELVRYQGLTSWINILLVFVLIVAAAMPLVPIRKKWQVLSIIAFVTFYLIATVARQSGWAAQVRDSHISLLDVSTFITDVSRVSIGQWLWSFETQLYLLISWSIVLFSLCWMTRWAGRWYRREAASQRQWLALTIIAYTLLIGLRFLFAPNGYQITGLMLLAALSSSEFPAWSLRRWNHQGAVLKIFLALLLVSGLARGWFLATASNRMLCATTYGDVIIEPEWCHFTTQVLGYLDENTQPDDAIAVLGPFPAIYYLGQRHNPFRQDFQVIGMGENEFEAQDFMERLARFAPAVLLSPQTTWNTGILDLQGNAGSGAWLKVSGQRAFRNAAPQVEQFILERYAFDRLIDGGNTFEVMGAFKRVR